MSVTPNCFLQFSKSAVEQIDEFSKRNSLSRAYYAAFHIANQHFPLPANLQGSTGMHKAYIQYLMQFPPKSVERDIGIKLQTLHSRRVKADYKIHLNIPTSDPAMQIIAAENVFKLLTK